MDIDQATKAAAYRLGYSTYQNEHNWTVLEFAVY